MRESTVTVTVDIQETSSPEVAAHQALEYIRQNNPICVVKYDSGKIVVVDTAITTIKGEEAPLEEVKALWAMFGDVPINVDEEIEEQWEHFPAGTDRSTIWHWFEDTYNITVATDLMYQER